MPASNDIGRSYEYAWVQTLFEALSEIRDTYLVENSCIRANERAWRLMSPETQRTHLISARAAVDTILELEPLMTEDLDELILQCKPDSAGEDGDVRDIVIRRDDIGWEIGLSVKHNHEAVKHSRLSYKLDFGEKWYGLPCSEEYWGGVAPIFNWLAKLKGEGVLWSELEDKDTDVYIPILEAFMDEIINAYEEDSNMVKRMVEYLIGTKDYYKVISHDSKHLTLIRTFNLHGDLNQPSGRRISAITVPIVDLPTELIELRFKPGSTNTVEMYLNNGWQLKFRIHNASTRVEPSLKFDIQFIGMPPTIMNIDCRWH